MKPLPSIAFWLYSQYPKDDLKDLDIPTPVPVLERETETAAQPEEIEPVADGAGWRFKNEEQTKVVVSLYAC